MGRSPPPGDKLQVLGLLCWRTGGAKDPDCERGGPVMAKNGGGGPRGGAQQNLEASSEPGPASLWAAY